MPFATQPNKIEVCPEISRLTELLKIKGAGTPPTQTPTQLLIWSVNFAFIL